MTVHDEPIYTRDEGYLASTHNIEFVLGGKHGRNEMVMPYLVIDRSGNAVDINHTEPDTCHGKSKGRRTGDQRPKQ